MLLIFPPIALKAEKDKNGNGVRSVRAFSARIIYPIMGGVSQLIAFLAARWWYLIANFRHICSANQSYAVCVPD
jgi:hypothetical protein